MLLTIDVAAKILYSEPRVTMVFALKVAWCLTIYKKNVPTVSIVFSHNYNDSVLAYNLG